MKQIKGVMLQYFEWHLKSNGQLWKQLAQSAKELSEIGFTQV